MFESRIKSLQDLIPTHEVDAFLITSPYNIAYLTGIRAFSIEEREARMLVTKDYAYLFTDARYVGMLNDKKFIVLREINSENPFSKQLIKILEKEKINEIGFEEENITYGEVSDLEEKLKKADLVPLVDIVEELRMVKDNDERTFVTKACQLTDKGFEYIQKFLKPGVTELEVKIQLENFMRGEGGSLSFESIVAFGINAAIPHHLSNNSKLKTTDLVLLDFGAKVEGYCSDMTRMVFIGQPSKELEKMYTATKEAQEIALDYLKTHMKDDFEAKKAHELANSHLKAVGFTQIPHGLGHGVGLQVHEMPSLSPYSEGELMPGTVVTVEPGVYVPEIGGIRIEDTILITQDGIEILTKSPKELTVL